MRDRDNRILAVVAGSVTVLVLLGFSQRLDAQLGMATLSGMVTDPSGAGIPNAQVTLESATEQRSRQLVTDSTGAYTIGAIPPGTYRLVVTATNFETKTITDISLSSGQGTTLNVTISLTKAVTEMTVHDVMPLLDTTSATVGGQVTSREFSTLPMLGRNFTTLLDTLPGVANIPSTDAFYATSGVQGLAIAPAVYGQRPRDTYYSLDGAVNMEPNFSRIGMLPPPEGIAEMKVESGMATGAYGWASGANVNIVTKSGTREFHGDVWEYFRNDKLNARSFFSPVVGAYKWNQFGVALGGPLVIPRLLSKHRAWYVFGWYEGVRVHKSSNAFAHVPTDAQLNGDFSGGPPIFNPYTSVVDAQGNVISRQQFPGNIIPTGTTNLCAPRPTCINPAALTLATGFLPRANLPPGLIPGENFFRAALSTETSNMWSARVDHQFGPKDNMYARFTDWNDPSVNQGISSFPSKTNIRYAQTVASETHLFSPTLLVTARFGMFRENQSDAAAGPDLAQQTGLTAIFPPWAGHDFIPTFDIPGYTGIGTFFGAEGPQYYVVPTADFQKVKGRHTLGFGVGYTRTSFRTGHVVGDEFFAPGQTAFAPDTGDSFASFLLGLPYFADRIGGTWLANHVYHAWNWYAQDAFKVTPKLSFNYGARWDYISGPITFPGIGTFDGTTGKYFYDVKNPIDGSPPNIRRGLIDPDFRSYQPRLGIAYQITPNTTFRSSFGVFVNLYGGNQQGPTGASGNWPYVFPQAVSGVNTGIPTAFLESPFPGPPVGSTVPLACQQCLNIEHSSTRNGYVEEWTASVQRQITPSTLFEADYFGSHGVKLWAQLIDNVAAVPGTDNYLNRVPYPNFASFIANNYGESMSWYDGLTAKVQKRYSQGLSFLLSYTWSHAIGQNDSLGTGQTFYQCCVLANNTRYNLQKFKGGAGFDLRQILSFSYAYDIPGKTGNKWADAVVANWQISGIVSADSGVPYYFFLTGDNENIGSAGRYTEFPNIVCDPDKGVKRSAQQWFNTACFTTPPFGSAGNGDKHAYYSDHLLNWDTSFVKQWPFQENRRVEFRAEFFNFTNSSTFDPPGSLPGTSNFGTISSTIRQPGRNIQFALKFHF